jgi:hypothetical protein
MKLKEKINKQKKNILKNILQVYFIREKKLTTRCHRKRVEEIITINPQ